MADDRLGFSTRAARIVHPVGPNPRPHVPPIYQTSTFVFDTVQQGAHRFGGEEPGYIYTRLGNPTVRAFERTIADLENAEDGAAFGSGMGAISATLLQLVRSKDHIVSGRTVYGCTHSLLKGLMSRMDVEVTFVDSRSIDNIREALQPNTRVIYAETPSNPTMDLVDLEALGELGRRTGITTVVDNTFMTPYLQRPLDWGIDIVVHSATKYLSGHGDVVAGAVAAGEAFLSELRADTMKDVGAILGPFDAWLVQRGIRTLPLRMERHSDSALKLARWLQDHPQVARVYYPGLDSHPQHDLATRQSENGFGGIVAFELQDGLEAGRILMDSVRLLTLAVSLGTTDTLIEHPASMTHSVLDEVELEFARISPGLVRISVGLEDVQDLVDDLDQAISRL